jgi:hypothetical protein
VREQVSHPHKKKLQNFSAVYFNICIFWTANWKTDDSGPNDSSIPWVHSYLTFIIWYNLKR